MSKPKNPEPCSRAFEDAFHDGVSGCVRTCACGRTCYDTANSYDWEEGELEKLQQDKNAVPLDYACSTMTIDGREYVMGCPCNGARKYEDWLRHYAEKIAAFLVKVREERLAHAEALKVADTLANFPRDPAIEDPGYPVHTYTDP